MSSILNVLQHTPWWVFAVFALLTWLGAQALRPRDVPVWRLLITPAIFILWGVASLVIQSTSAPILVADWSAAAVVGAAIAWTTSRLDRIKIDRVQRQVSLPGSTSTLIRNVLIFSAKYGLGAAAAMMPAWRSELALVPSLRCGTSRYPEQAPATSWGGSRVWRRPIDGQPTEI